MKNNKLINSLGLIFVVVIIFISGFYFGYKNAKASSDAESTTTTFSNNATDNTNKTPTEALAVDGVFWIKVGQDPICTETHPIKGTFSTDFGSFYTKENSRYDRIKPDVCFATEEYARDSAGFIKKF